MDYLIFATLTALVSFSCLTDTSNPTTLGSTKSQITPQSTSSSSSNLCGIPKTKSGLDNKIVGGNTSNVEYHPWYVALAKKEGNMYIVSCGATLITSTHIITAAHCYDGSMEPPTTRYRIVFNLQNRCIVDEKKVKEATAKMVIIHKKYGKGSSDLPENDIAMIVLTQPVSNTPICLPSRATYDGWNALILGYGSTKVRSVDGTYPCELKEANINIFSKDDCMKSGLGTNVAQKAICAGKMEGKVDACDGDSGGPLMVKVNNKYELLGVTSYGEGCGRKNLPGVYTDVSMSGQGKWIEEKLKRTTPGASGNLPGGSTGQQTGSSTGGQGSLKPPKPLSLPAQSVNFGILFPGFPHILFPPNFPKPLQSFSMPPEFALLNAIFNPLPPLPPLPIGHFMDPIEANMMNFAF